MLDELWQWGDRLGARDWVDQVDPEGDPELSAGLRTAARALGDEIYGSALIGALRDSASAACFAGAVRARLPILHSDIWEYFPAPTALAL